MVDIHLYAAMPLIDKGQLERQESHGETSMEEEDQTVQRRGHGYALGADAVWTLKHVRGSALPGAVDIAVLMITIAVTAMALSIHAVIVILASLLFGWLSSS